MPSFLGPDDLALVVVVSAQATVLAYLYQPKWKALLLTLPIPFTFATLALGQRVDATNVLGMAVLLLFTHAVRLLHGVLRVPIVLAIAVSAVGYCAIGWLLARWLPPTDAAFWVCCAGIVALAVVVLRQQPPRDEPGHRTSLPVWIKLPIIVGVVLFLVLIKQQLRGFMTMFPMVGVIAAYEARHSLWTISRQIPVLMLTMVPFLMVSRLTSEWLGLPGSLALGWVAFLAVLAPLTRWLWKDQISR